MLAHWQPAESGAKVLGLRLVPLTIGHVYLLAELRSPIVTGEDGADPLGELGLACIACASDVITARQDIERLLGAQGWRARRASRKWATHCAKLDFPAEAEKFREWFTHQVDGPRQKRDMSKDGGNTLSAPWWFNLVANIGGEFGWAPDIIKALTVREAKQLLSARLESSGSAEFTSQADEDFRTSVDYWKNEVKRRGLNSITELRPILEAEAKAAEESAMN